MQSNDNQQYFAVTEMEQALARILSLALAGVEFTVGRDEQGRIKIRVSNASDQLVDYPSPGHLVIQEGESSEFFASLHSDRKRAEAHMHSCRENAGYRTTEVIEIPPVLALLGTRITEMAENLAAKTMALLS